MNAPLGIALIAVVGCNRALGLDQTQLVDALGPDAAPTCARDALAFDPQLRQVVLQPCSSYTTSEAADRALAICFLDGRLTLAEGRIDAPLAPIAVSGHPEPIVAVALAPDGARALIHHVSTTAPGVIASYVRDDAGWRWTHDLPITLDYDDTIGSPTGGPNMRVLHARPNSGVVDELVEDGPATWRVVHSYTPAELGTIHVYLPLSFTPDGLHAVFGGMDANGNRHVLHATRASLDDRLATGVPLAGVPRSVNDPYMTGDCGRVYFSGLSSIFYARQP